MIRGMLGRSAAKRLGRGLPLVQLWTVGQLTLLAGDHMGRLDREERRRLVSLIAEGRGRPSRLSDADAHELRRLVGKLEPRLFAGTAVSRLSPVPVPKRLLFGGRKSPARLAARQQRA
jgi:hypothetical protein